MRRQLHIFLTAVMFYTRIPCPSWVDHSPDLLNRATVYFPVIGWIVGAVAALTIWLVFPTYSLMTAVMLSMIATILLTGAFHEDGFADVCDGFGGGWTKERILEIMKDSRVGAYGVIGLICLLGLKYHLLMQLLPNKQPLLQMLLLLVAHTWSRGTALTFIYTHSYVREDAESKAKPVAERMSGEELLLALAFTAAPMLALWQYSGVWAYWLVAVPLLVVKWYLGRYFTRWIGGYTGDCLGATQQIAEVVLLMSLAGVERWF